MDASGSKFPSQRRMSGLFSLPIRWLRYNKNAPKSGYDVIASASPPLSIIEDRSLRMASKSAEKNKNHTVTTKWTLLGTVFCLMDCLILPILCAVVHITEFSINYLTARLPTITADSATASGAPRHQALIACSFLLNNVFMPLQHYTRTITLFCVLPLTVAALLLGYLHHRRPRVTAIGLVGAGCLIATHIIRTATGQHSTAFPSWMRGSPLDEPLFMTDKTRIPAERITSVVGVFCDIMATVGTMILLLSNYWSHQLLLARPHSTSHNAIQTLSGYALPNELIKHPPANEEDPLVHQYREEDAAEDGYTANIPFSHDAALSPPRLFRQLRSTSDVWNSSDAFPHRAVSPQSSVRSKMYEDEDVDIERSLLSAYDLA